MKWIENRPRIKHEYTNGAFRGYAYYWKGKAANAIVDYSQAIELRPNYAYAYNNRGAASMASGRPDQAICDLNRAIQLQPDFPQVYTNRGNAFLRKGRIDLAIADFSRAGKNPIGFIAILCGISVGIVLSGAVVKYRIARQRLLAKRRRAIETR